MSLAGDYTKVNHEALHQLFYALLGMEADRVIVRTIDCGQFPACRSEILFRLIQHSLTMAFIQYFAAVQGFPDQGVTFPVTALGVFRRPGQEIYGEGRISAVQDLQGLGEILALKGENHQQPRLNWE